MSELSIRALGLSKRYRTGVSPTLLGDVFRRRRRDRYIWALRDVEFEARKGESLGIVGPNGSGKSTLLKILSRVTRPTSGRAEIYGKVGSLLEVGTGFHPELTGRENIYLNGNLLGLRNTAIDRKLERILDFSEIDGLIDTPVKRYSSGMKVRLGFSVAIHLDADILLVDEVLAVGDAAFRQKCLAQISALVSKGRTVLLVSHNTSILRSVCRRALWIEQGRIRKRGRTPDVIQAYLQSVDSPEPREGAHELETV